MGHTFADAFTLLLAIQESKAPNTFEQSKCVVAILQWFQDNHPDLEKFETDYEEIWAQFKSHCKKTRPGKKLKHCQRYLVMALRRASKKGWIKKAFSKQDFQLLESSEPIGKWIPDEKAQLMLNYLRDHSEKTYLQCLMAYTMGLRISEILQLKKEEIDLENQEINLDASRLKTRRPRKVPIPITTAVYALLRARFERAEGVYIFPSETRGTIDWNKPQSDNSYYWKKARKAANFKCRFHDWRHACLSNALANGMPPLTASKIFGCTQQVLERVYDHIRLKDRELHRAILDGKKAP